MHFSRPSYDKKTYALPAIVLIAGLSSFCAPSPKLAGTEKVAVRIADDVCNEVDNLGADEWVTVLCQVESVAGSLVKVILPRKQWGAIRGSQNPAPGK